MKDPRVHYMTTDMDTAECGIEDPDQFASDVREVDCANCLHLND